MEALRKDDGKARFDLVPPELEEEVAEVLTQPVRSGKYPARNWELGMDYGRCLASLKRHLNKRIKGERVDAESGRPHLAHVITNAMFMLVYELRNVGTDDLSPFHQGKPADAEGPYAGVAKASVDKLVEEIKKGAPEFVREPIPTPEVFYADSKGVITGKLPDAPAAQAPAVPLVSPLK